VEPIDDPFGLPSGTGVQVGVNADRTTTLRLAGEIGPAALPLIRRAVNSVAGTAPLIMDLSEVTYLDGAGVRLLFEVARERSLEICLGPGCAVFPVIRVSGLDEVAVIRSG
jgi:anti-anti-sigma factor